MSDLQWSEWIDWNGGTCPLQENTKHQLKFRDKTFSQIDSNPFGWHWGHNPEDNERDIISYRVQLNEPSGISEEDEEAAIQEHYERLNNEESIKVSANKLSYVDGEGRDWIDEFAATATVDEFRGAMKFTIGKYLRRAGKKDALQSEIEKIGDYARRWADYERELEKGYE